LDPQLNFEHEARQFESNCGKSATRCGSLQIFGRDLCRRFSVSLLREVAHGLRLELAQAGGLARPRVTIISPL
jgi:hypothetical protein